MRPPRLLDWRFLAAAASCVLVLAIVVLAFQSRAAKDQQIADLIQDGRQGRAEAAASRDQASQERQRLIRQAQRLTRLYRDLLARQNALLAYLQAEGIPVPDLADRKSSGPARPDSGRSSRPDGKSSGANAPDGSNGGAAAPPNGPGPGGPDTPSPVPGPPAPPGPPTPVRDLLDDLLEGLTP